MMENSSASKKLLIMNLDPAKPYLDNEQCRDFSSTLVGHGRHRVRIIWLTSPKPVNLQQDRICHQRYYHSVGSLLEDNGDLAVNPIEIMALKIPQTLFIDNKLGE